MTEFNLNEIENVVKTKFFTPIIIPDSQQIEFKRVNDVREYAKGPGDLPAHIMMNRMLEAFFGHYSTCLIRDVKGLTAMFAKLYRGWVDRLYERNRDLAPDDYYFEPYIHEKRVQFDQLYKEGNDDVKRAIVAQRLAFHAHHRTKTEIEILVSQYVFKIASRYYNVPFTKTKDLVKMYNKFRYEFIEEWYDVVESYVMLKVFPDVEFVSLEPRTVAMNVFPQDKELYASELDERLNNYIKWHKKASRADILEARKLNDPGHLMTVQNKWDSALMYAKSLHDGMMKMAHELEDYEEDDFIVDDDDVMEDDEAVAEQNERTDRALLDSEVTRGAAKYDNMDTYNVDDYTLEQIEDMLRKDDKKQRKRDKRVSKFIDRVEEDD